MAKMMDNNKVNVNSALRVGKAEGVIKHKIQGKVEKTWQSGDMSWKGDGADFKRKDASLTPRKA